MTKSQVERKHLLGQELKPGKRRGRAPSAATLGKKTYRKLASQVAARQQTIVKDDVVGMSSQARRQFSQNMAAFRVGKWKHIDVKGKVVLGALNRSFRKKRKKAARAYDVFSSQAYGQVGPGSFGEKRARVVQRYRALSADDHAVLQGTAQEVLERQQNAGGQDLSAAGVGVERRKRGRERLGNASGPSYRWGGLSSLTSRTHINECVNLDPASS